MSKSTPNTSASESNHQVAFFDVIRMNQPQPPMVHRRVRQRPDLFAPEYVNHPLYILTRFRHFPNGGHRHASVAVQLQREGVRRGAFDIYLDAQRHGFAGLRMEAKREDEKLSDYQLEERYWLEREGYAVHIGWHYKELLDVGLWYCEISPSQIKGYPTKHVPIVLPKKGGHNKRCGCDLRI